jgi:hypothetical protein
MEAQSCRESRSELGTGSGFCRKFAGHLYPIRSTFRPRTMACDNRIIFSSKRRLLLKESLLSVAPQAVAEQEQDLWVLSLASLLEDCAPGLFRIFLRGPLGLEKTFHLAYLAAADLQFDREFYGAESGSLTFAANPSKKIALTEPPFTSYTGRAVIDFPAAASEIGIQIGASSSRSLALTLHIPRIRWRFRGLSDGQASQWNCQPLEIDLHCWEQYAEQLELLLDLPDGSGLVWLEHPLPRKKYTRFRMENELFASIDYANFPTALGIPEKL